MLLAFMTSMLNKNVKRNYFIRKTFIIDKINI